MNEYSLFGMMNSSNQLWFVPVLIWDLVWKGIALYKSARNKQDFWFIALLIFNTAGILPIIYILFFQEDKNKHRAERK